MLLLYLLCLISLQLSVGLKVSRNSFPNEILSGASHTIQHTSKIISITSKNAIAALAVCSSISFGLAYPLPCHAASGLVASSLFEKAEAAIDVNLQDFKNLEKEWASGKKIIGDNQALLTKASTSLSSVSKQMTLLEATISKMIDEDSIATNEISDEILLLRESTGMKYAAAEASSAAVAKPALTAQLFLSAQKEAALLEQSEISFKKFVEVIGPAGSDSSYKKRADEVLEGLTEMVGRATDVQAEQESGMKSMEEGLLLSAKSCRDSLNQCAETGDQMFRPAGLVEFKVGLKVADNAQTKFLKLKKEFATYLKTMQTVESEILKVNDALTLLLIEDKTWEDTFNSKMRNGRKSIETVNLKYKTSLTETAKMIQKLSETSTLLLSETDKGQRKEVSDELKIVFGYLENANESGKNAENLLKAAKVQGDKESAKYLKFVKPAPVAISVVTIPEKTVTETTKITKTVKNEKSEKTVLIEKSVPKVETTKLTKK